MSNNAKIIFKTTLGAFLFSTNINAADDGQAHQIPAPVVKEEKKGEQPKVEQPKSAPVKKGRGAFKAGSGATLESDRHIPAPSHSGRALGGHDRRGTTQIGTFQALGSTYKLGESDGSGTLSYFAMSGHSKDLSKPHLTLEDASASHDNMSCHVTFGHAKSDGNYVEVTIHNGSISAAHAHGRADETQAKSIVSAYLAASKA